MSQIDGGSLAQGYDLQARPDLRLGLAFSRSVIGFNSLVGGDSGSITGNHLALYGDWASPTWFARGVIQVEWFDQTTERRNIPGAVGTSVATVGLGEASGRAASLDLQVGWVLHTASGAQIAPYLSAARRWQRRNAFTETGAGAFSMTVPEASLAQSELGIGVHATTPSFDLGRLEANFTTDLSYARVFGDRGFDTDAQMPGYTVTIATQQVGADAVRLGVKLRIGGKDGAVQVELGYSTQYQKDASASQFSIRLRMTF